MSFVLYYSRNCPQSIAVLRHMQNLPITSSVHFLCVDRRVVEGNAEIIISDTGNRYTLPPEIISTPALLDISTHYGKIVFGDDIYPLISPKLGCTADAAKTEATGGLVPFQAAIATGSDFTGRSGVSEANPVTDGLNPPIQVPKNSDRITDAEISAYTSNRSVM